MGCQTIYVLSYNCCITYSLQSVCVCVSYQCPVLCIKKSDSYIASQQIYVVQVIMCVK